MRARLFIASDHAGFQLKETLKKTMHQIEWVDVGPFDSARVDYPDFADQVCKRVLAERTTDGGRGVLICGSGQGMAIRANRYREIRAALVWNEESVKLSREHNDANVVCLGARMVTPLEAQRLIELFLEVPFAGGRHKDRVTKLDRAPASS